MLMFTDLNLRLKEDSGHLRDFTALDMRNLTGVDKYIDSEAEREIKSRLKGFGFRGIHLIDNGNYHYATRFFLEKIPFDFDLLVFDNHSDDQAPAFEGMRSCGSWVLDTKTDLGERLKGLSIIQNQNHTKNEAGSSRPIYLSIDLDILSKDEIDTNWDQGDWTLENLLERISLETTGREVLGIDVCGGPLIKPMTPISGTWNQAVNVYSRLIAWIQAGGIL